MDALRIPEPVGDGGDHAAFDLLAGQQRHRESVWRTHLPSPALIELHQAIHMAGVLVIPDQTATANQRGQLAEDAL